MPRPHVRRAAVAAFALVTVCTIPASWGAPWAAYAGPLDPPAGPIAPTPGPEARIAVNATNTPGDTFNLFRITAPGSYYLTGNLTGLHSRACIQIAASNVTLDLNGFTLVGAPSSLAGVTTSGGLSNVAVRNGVVTGWDQDAVNLQGVSTNAVVENLRVDNITGTGIVVGPHAVVRACAVNDCSLAGISVNASGVVADCTTANNAVGITTGPGATVTGCSVHANILHGVIAGNNSVLTGCASYENASMGFVLGTGCILDRCTSIANGSEGVNASPTCTITNCIVSSNQASGINIAGGCLVQNCLCVNNGFDKVFHGAGIRISGPDNRVESNTCNSNFIGVHATASGSIIIRNHCSDSTTANWLIAEGNKCFVVEAPDCGPIAGNSGGTPFGSTDPNANFTY